jgi:hypothetical protein
MYREEGSEDDFCSMIRFVFNKTKMKYLGIFELKNKEENVMHHGRTCTKYTFKLLQKETTYHFEYGPR